MRALKRIRHRIETDPTAPASQQLAHLVLALEGEGSMDVKALYDLDFNAFELALELLREWRLEGHFSAKFRLMDVSVAAQALRSDAKP